VDDEDAPRLFTGRLELVAATAELARAAATSAEALAAALGCALPTGWPPEALKTHAPRWATLAGWGEWYIVQASPALLVGSIGLAGRPDDSGAVECAWAMLPAFERKGYATEAMGGLIDWAFSHAEVRRIRAQAPRKLAAAIRVLERNGLSHVGDGDAPETLRFELARPES
jgi:ribosomal-protein-alanine N-acetyltransferase